MRIEVSNQLVEVINEFGPTMFDDFDEVRPLFSAPQTVPYQRTRSGASSSLPQPPHRQAANRGSGGGRVQQVASTLRATSSCTPWYVPIPQPAHPHTHSFLMPRPPQYPHSPQTWLDERLFGWSRSARRGTSAWAGTRSHEISRAATPDVSDEEDAPDYDDLLAVPGAGVNGNGAGSDDGAGLASRPRSQRSSYADLQRLRRSSSAAPTNGGGAHLQPLSPVSPATSSAVASAGGDKDKDKDGKDGLHFRGQAARPRKPSLSDSVPVEVIGQVDRAEPFVDATTDLNREMKKRRESMSSEGEGAGKA